LPYFRGVEPINSHKYALACSNPIILTVQQTAYKQNKKKPSLLCDYPLSINSSRNENQKDTKQIKEILNSPVGSKL